MSEKSNPMIGVRLPDAEFEEISDAAFRAGMSRAAWVRAILLASARDSVLSAQVEKARAARNKLERKADKR